MDHSRGLLRIFYRLLLLSSTEQQQEQFLFNNGIRWRANFYINNTPLPFPRVELLSQGRWIAFVPVRLRSERSDGDRELLGVTRPFVPRWRSSGVGEIRKRLYVGAEDEHDDPRGRPRGRSSGSSDKNLKIEVGAFLGPPVVPSGLRGTDYFLLLFDLFALSFELLCFSFRTPKVSWTRSRRRTTTRGGRPREGGPLWAVSPPVGERRRHYAS